jgi:uncharacterized protein YfiM (DUF2279 family)
MRTGLVFATGFLLIMVSCTAPLLPGDKWAHGLLSACITSAGVWMAIEAGADDGTAIACGMGLSAYLGVVKEYSDCRAGGRFDGGDLLANLAGILAGASVSGLLMEE